MAAKADKEVTTTKPAKTVTQAADDVVNVDHPGYVGTRVGEHPADHYTVAKVIERETDG